RPRRSITGWRGPSRLQARRRSTSPSPMARPPSMLSARAGSSSRSTAIRRIASRTSGRDSVTLYRRLAESAGVSLLGCRLVTGRTHQIRVHLQAAGMPIVGDPLYGEPRWKGIGDPEIAAACRDFPRQALHAWRVAFVHPVTGESLEIAAPVPDDLAGLLAAAGLKGSPDRPG